jgi:two-component system nitrogen regulation response regulator GlnG
MTRANSLHPRRLLVVFVTNPGPASSPDSVATAPAPAALDSAAPSRLPAAQPGIVCIFPRPLERAPELWSSRKKLLIGRGQDADLRLDDSCVSRRHAELHCGIDGIRVVDLESRHGTFVQGERLGTEPCTAPYGSLLRLGESLFLAVPDVREFAAPPLRLRGHELGLQRDVLAGPRLSRVWSEASQVAKLSQPALILGESGTGKEAIARLIHAQGLRRGPFVAINVAAIPDGLFESELFGHARGAFTGAHAARLGAFREATGGVLFLDEVADLRLDLQVKLLRAIDQMRVRPLGASEDVAVDVRIVAATSQDIRGAAERGDFRLDLYYRLSGIVIEVPPLRERPDDVVLLASRMLSDENPGLSLGAAAAELLALSLLPGNVRELAHAITHAVVQASLHGASRIEPRHLPELRRPEAERDDALAPRAVHAALADSQGNAAAAARALGISRTTLYKVLKREGIDPRTLRTR